MSDVKDKPGYTYDSDKDGDAFKNIVDNYGDTADPEQEDKNVAAAKTSLGEKEASAGIGDGQGSATADKESGLGSNFKLGGALAGGGKNSSKSTSKLSAKGMLNNQKKKIIAGAGAAIVSAAIGLLLLIPSLTIEALRDIMTGKIGDLQSQHMRRYRRARLARLSDSFSVDGRRASRVVAEMERAGYTFRFSDTNKNQLLGVTRPGGKTSVPNLEGALADEIDGFIESRHPFRFSKWKTKRMNAFYSRYGVKRSSIIKNASPEAAEDASKALSKSMYATLDQDNTKIRPQARSNTGPDDPPPTDNDLAKQADIDKATGDLPAVDEAKIAAATGKPLENTGDVGRAVKAGGTGLFDETTAKAIENVTESNPIGAFKGIVSPADIGDRVCTLRNRIRTGLIAARTVRAITAYRYTAAAVLAPSDDIRQGKVNPKMYNELLKRFTTGKENPMASSSGYSYAMKGRFSKSKNDLTKSAIAVDGKPIGTFGGIVEKVELMPGCSIWQNPGAQISLGVAQIAIVFFSGGTGGLFIGGSKVALKEAIEQTVKQIITKAVAKKILYSVGKTIAYELSFEGVMTLAQIYAQRSLGFNFTGQETQSMLTDITIAGAGVGNKQRSLAAGLVPATSTQYAQAYETYLAEKKQEFNEKSFFARVMDRDSIDSFAFQASMQLQTSPQAATATIANSFGTLPSTVASVLTSPLKAISPTVYAQDSDEIAFDTYSIERDGQKLDLATDFAGNLLPIMRSDIEAIDPEENLEYLKSDADGGPHIRVTDNEPSSSSFIEHITNCVERIDTLTILETSDSNEHENDCMANLPLTKRFKAHLAYLDYLDGFDAEFFPEDISEKPITPGTPATPGKLNGDPYSSSVNEPCDPRTVDLGTHEAYVEGSAVPMRLCALPNMPSTASESIPGSGYYINKADGMAIVNSWVESAWFDLVEAAKKDSITITAGSSFRSMAHQQALFGGDTSRVARPGYSSHQAGVAIDINELYGDGDVKSGATCPTGGPPPGMTVYQWLNSSADGSVSIYPVPEYEWMVNNANKFGLKQYAAESWHFDMYNSSNRCSFK